PDGADLRRPLERQHQARSWWNDSALGRVRWIVEETLREHRHGEYPIVVVEPPLHAERALTETVLGVVRLGGRAKPRDIEIELDPVARTEVGIHIRHAGRRLFGQYERRVGQVDFPLPVSRRAGVVGEVRGAALGLEPALGRCDERQHDNARIPAPTHIASDTLLFSASPGARMPPLDGMPCAPARCPRTRSRASRSQDVVTIRRTLSSHRARLTYLGECSDATTI